MAASAYCGSTIGGIGGGGPTGRPSGIQVSPVWPTCRLSLRAPNAGNASAAADTARENARRFIMRPSLSVRCAMRKSDCAVWSGSFLARGDHVRDLRRRRRDAVGEFLFAVLGETGRGGGNSDGSNHRAVAIAYRRGDTADTFQIFRVVGCKAALANLLALLRQRVDAHDGVP